MPKKEHYLQIDLLKAIAIFAVLMLHTFPFIDLHKIPLNPLFVTVISTQTIDYLKIITNFTLFQAVPLFFVIMGFNMGLSFKRRQYTKISQIFTLNYFKGRFKRIVLPVIVVCILSIILALLVNIHYYIGILTLIGVLPITGPGNYFISIVLEFIIVFPFLYIFYTHNPKLTLISSFIISFLFEISALHFSLLMNDSYLYKANIFRFLFVITLGLWSIENIDFKKIFSNKLLILGSLFSISYILFYSFFNWNVPFFGGYWATQNVLSFFYPLLIFVVGMKLLPTISKNKLLNFIGTIGKASYHIFLLQIVFFTLIPAMAVLIGLNVNLHLSVILSLIINFGVLIPAGLLFFSAENFVFKKISHFKRM